MHIHIFKILKPYVWYVCQTFDEAKIFILGNGNKSDNEDADERPVGNGATNDMAQLLRSSNVNSTFCSRSSSAINLNSSKIKEEQSMKGSVLDIRFEASSSTYLNLGKCEGDWSLAEAREFDRAIEGNLLLPSSNSIAEKHYKSLLRRTTAVTVLTNRLRLAKTEDQCYEVVTRLIVSLFDIDRCTFTLLKDKKHFFVKQCSCKKDAFAPDFRFTFNDSEFNALLKNTAVGHL